jgi:hypothetical protein
MASDFPASLDAFPDPLVNSPLNSPSHAALHQDVNDAVEKIEVKLGVNASPASGASNGRVLMADGAGGSDWSNIGAGNIKTEGAPAGSLLVSDGAGSGAFVTNDIGLVQIGTFTANGTSRALVCDNIFTSEYDNYRIYFSLNSTINTNGCFFQYINTAGTTLNTGYGATAYGMDYFGGTSTFTATLSATTVQFIGYLPNSTFGATKLNAIVDIGNPFLNEPTQCTGTQSGIASGLTFHGGNINGTHNVAATLRGIRVDNSGAGNLTGKVRVYGYKN